MEEKRFPYKPNILGVLFATLCFGGMSTFIGFSAINNDRGLILNGIIEFSEGSATILYWIISLFFGGITILLILTLINSLTLKREIIIQKNKIISPKNGYSRNNEAVNFMDISEIYIEEIQKNISLIIKHKKGKLVISNQMLPNKEAFAELTKIVFEKAKLSK